MSGVEINRRRRGGRRDEGGDIISAQASRTRSSSTSPTRAARGRPCGSGARAGRRGWSWSARERSRRTGAAWRPTSSARPRRSCGGFRSSTSGRRPTTSKTPDPYRARVKPGLVAQNLLVTQNLLYLFGFARRRPARAARHGISTHLVPVKAIQKHPSRVQTNSERARRARAASPHFWQDVMHAERPHWCS